MSMAFELYVNKAVGFIVSLCQQKIGYYHKQAVEKKKNDQ